MILHGAASVFCGGALGWVLVELCKFGLVAAGDTGTITPKYRSFTFWAGAFALMVVSGIVAVLNGTEGVPLMKAVQFGIGAPALVSGWATSIKSKGPSRKRIGVGPGGDQELQSQPDGLLLKTLKAQSW